MTSAYLPEPKFSHGSAPAVGVLLVNLGTPSAATRKALRRYLKEFLLDTRVVEIPRFVWKPLLYGVILPFRSGKSARKYASIWTEEGSPLRVHTARQAKLLQGYLGERISAPVVVEHAMRYGDENIANGMARLRAQCRGDQIVQNLCFRSACERGHAQVHDHCVRTRGFEDGIQYLFRHATVVLLHRANRSIDRVFDARAG